MLKTKDLLLFGLTALLFSSCATVFSGMRQNVSISSNDPNVEINIDDDKVIRGNGKVWLARRKDHVIKVKQEGYEEMEYKLKRRTNPAVWGNVALFPIAIVAGAVLASQKDTYIDNTIPGYPFEVEEPREPQSTIGIWTLSFSWLAPLLPFSVDAITGSMYRFEKDVNLDVTKIPGPSDPDDVVALMANQVNVKIPPGTKIGSIHNLRGNSYSDISWENIGNVSYEDLLVQTNNTLNDLGMNVPGLRNLKEKMVKEGTQSFMIEGEIKELSYDIFTESLTTFSTDCEIDITWRLLQPRTKEVVYFFSTTSSASTQENGGAIPVYRALTRSIYALYKDEQFQELIQKESRETRATISTSNDTEASEARLSIQRTEVKGEQSATEIAGKNKDAVVTIINNAGHGSGFLISADGYLVTNAHVVEGFSDLKVKFSNGFSFSPEVVTIHRDADVALLKVPGDGYPFASLNDIQPELGEEVIVIGTPAQEDLSQTITKGVVSGMRLIDQRKLIQTDAAISPGNSGGPMFNQHGQVIGIVTSKIVQDGVESIGFGIPTSVAMEILGISFE